MRCRIAHYHRRRAMNIEKRPTDDPVYRRELARAVYALAEAVKDAGLYEPKEQDEEEPADF